MKVMSQQGQVTNVTSDGNVTAVPVPSVTF